MANAAFANITAACLTMAFKSSMGAIGGSEAVTNTDIDMVDAEMTDVGLTGVDVVDVTTDVIMMDASIMDSTGQIEV